MSTPEPYVDPVIELLKTQLGATVIGTYVHDGLTEIWIEKIGEPHAQADS